MKRSLTIYNSSTKKRIEFTPIKSDGVMIYTCGPTVYDYTHIGNARSAISADIIYRICKHLFPKTIHTRNITDVDDKIINKAEQEGTSPHNISTTYTAAFHKDMQNVHCLPPDIEPKATEHIKEMLDMIGTLIANGHAYETSTDVLFDVNSYSNYGNLFNKQTESMIDGSRISNSAEKKNTADFTLWKKTLNNDEIYWDSPWGRGRPGWHIECSAMSTKYLGQTFDIHCGGVDLKFPHHENEAAQSICAMPNSKFAKHWIHNGSLTVNGEKMSKSLGNTIKTKDIAPNPQEGEILRYAMLQTHYRKPINWQDSTMQNARADLGKMYNALKDYQQQSEVSDIIPEFLEALLNDINTYEAISVLKQTTSQINKTTNKAEKSALQNQLKNSAQLIGLLNHTYDQWFCVNNDERIAQLLQQRKDLRNNKKFAEADSIRDQLLQEGIEILDGNDGTTTWRKKNS